MLFIVQAPATEKNKFGRAGDIWVCPLLAHLYYISRRQMSRRNPQFFEESEDEAVESREHV